MSPFLQFISKYGYVHFLRNWSHQVHNSIHKLENYTKIVEEQVFDYFSFIPRSLHKDEILTFLVEKSTGS